MSWLEDMAPLIAECRRILQQNGQIENVLQYLKEHNGSKVAAMAITAEILNIPLEEAKALVHYSKTWSYRRESDEAFEREALKALEKLARRQNEM